VSSPPHREGGAVTARAESQFELNYGLDDVPRPFAKALGLGVQHVLTMFGATVLVPLLLGPAMGMSTSQIAILVSSVFVCSGLATVVRVQFGSRLPIIQGGSFACLPAFFGIIAAHPGEDSMRYIAGGVLSGAVFDIAIGFGGVSGFLRRCVTPVTIAPGI